MFAVGVTDLLPNAFHMLLQLLQMAMQRLLSCLADSMDCPTAFVGQHEHEGHVEVFHGVFEGSQHVFVYDVAGIAYLKDAADSLIEDELRAYPTVGAAEDDGERMLLLCHFVAILGVMGRIGRKGSGGFHEAGIAALEFGKRGLGVGGREPSGKRFRVIVQRSV